MIPKNIRSKLGRGFLKFDIGSFEQLLSYLSQHHSIPNHKRISITLLDKIDALENADYYREIILLNFSDDRRTFKRTYKDRFEIFDKKVLDVIAAQSISSLRVHDIAVSDGRTTCDFYEKLQRSFPVEEYFASDYSPDIIVINDKITTNPDGKILEVIFYPFVFGNQREGLRYPINNAIRSIVFYGYAPYLLKRYLKNPSIEKKTIQMFCSTAQRLASSDNRFHLMKYNVLNPSPIARPLNIIRAMNIFNPAYFSDAQITLALKNIYGALENGGLFITGSNQDADSLVHGGVYQKTNTGFKELWRSGEGSPCGTHIHNFRVA